MAKNMKGAHWDKYTRKRFATIPKYKWEEWLNGDMWLLIHGDDFPKSMPIVQFQRYLLRYAREHGIKVKTQQNIKGTGLYVKAERHTATMSSQAKRQHFQSMEVARKREQMRKASKKVRGDKPREKDMDDLDFPNVKDYVIEERARQQENEE